MTFSEHYDLGCLKKSEFQPSPQSIPKRAEIVHNPMMDRKVDQAS